MAWGGLASVTLAPRRANIRSAAVPAGTAVKYGGDHRATFRSGRRYPAERLKIEIATR